MPTDTATLWADLARVAAQRQRRQANAALAQATLAIKHYQHQRFAHSYADLLGDARYGGAARFFLDDLYGTRDFSQRDAQFARVVPALVRLFPQEIVDTVGTLGALHALSEELDSAMAAALGARAVDAAGYAAAWREVGRAEARAQQIELVLRCGQALDVYTRKPLLRQTLRLMRAPAQAAGMSELQTFLEAGFDAFRAMRGAQVFLDTIAQRERALAAQLFAAGPAL